MQLKPLDEAVPPMTVASRNPILVEVLKQVDSAWDLSGDIACLHLSAMAAARYRQELAWLSALPGLGCAASAVLAAHAVGCMMAMRPREYSARHDGSGDVFSGLASVRPDRAALERAAFVLLPDAGTNGGLSAEDLTCIDALWPLTAPAEFLLASGGDDRLALDAHSGLNKYGCAPWPRPELISFGSCTASSLSAGAFRAAELARRALAAASLSTSPATALAEASEAIGAALLRHFGVEDLAEAVLAASGTDAALVVTGLLAAEHPGEALTSILVSPSETGSGVPDAVQGRHFASSAPSGSLVGKGEPIDGLAFGPALVTVALRDAAGAPRPPAEVDAAFEAAIRAGIQAGRVVLHAMDGSKTGLTAPDRAVCRRLADTYGPKLDIIIDACQARIEPALIRWYLQQGFAVLVTGSKFFAAPGFCGAVLFPRLRLQRITRAGRLPAGLAAYARLQGGFGSRRCPGLVLRWSAALHEMAVFGSMPAETVGQRLDHLAGTVAASLACDERLQMAAAPRPSGMGWSDRRSVFTFTVQGPRGVMSPGMLRLLYCELADDCSPAVEGGALRCQIGQPVELGHSNLGGLRIAFSAAQIVRAGDEAEELRLAVQKLGKLLDADRVE